jgi:hypothetical protein
MRIGFAIVECKGEENAKKMEEDFVFQEVKEQEEYKNTLAGQTSIIGLVSFWR